MGLIISLDVSLSVVWLGYQSRGAGGPLISLKKLCSLNNVCYTQNSPGFLGSTLGSLLPGVGHVGD